MLPLSETQKNHPWDLPPMVPDLPTPPPPASNQVTIRGCQFYQNCSSHSQDIVVTISEQTNEWTNLRHNAFADIVGWQRV